MTLHHCPTCGAPPTASANHQQQKSLLRKIMSRLYARERERNFTITDARMTLKKFGHKSIWNGEHEPLTITRIDKTRPLTTDNAMVVTTAEALRHPPPAVLDRATEIHTATLEK